MKKLCFDDTVMAGRPDEVNSVQYPMTFAMSPAVRRMRKEHC